MDQLAFAVNVVRAMVYNTFYYSFKTGQFIILGFKLLADLLVLTLKGLNLMLLTLSDSFSVFSEDVARGIQHVADFVALIIQEFQKLSNCVLFVFEAIITVLMLIHKFFNGAIQSLLHLLTSSVIYLKQLVVLFGSGVWFTVTLLPIFIYNLSVFLIRFIVEIFQEIGTFVLESCKAIKASIKDFYDFVTDVPVESVIGLIVTVSLIYIFTQFYITIFTCVSQKMFRLLLKIRQILNRTRQVRLLAFLNSNQSLTGRFPQVRRSLSSPEVRNKNNLNRSNDDRYCIICQERSKCILLLPCRHVCMCSECNTRLQLYDNSCPICRNHIEETMRIFV